MNEISSPVESEMKMINYYIDECTFVRKAPLANQQGSIELEYNFNRTITKISDENYTVSLRANVSSKDGSIEVHTRAVGNFQIKCAEENRKRVLVSKNTVAILLPFIRSQIILVTSQTGLSPIVLPVVNIAAMFDDQLLSEELGG